MELDTIKLTADTCQRMYTKTLIANEEGNTAKAAASNLENKSQNISPSFKSLGENQKKILFLINNTKNIFLPEEEMKLLTDLLLACKMSMADISLINYQQNQPLPFSRLMETSFEKIFVFGVSASELQMPLSISPFQIENYQNKTLLFCPPLTDFLNNKAFKKDLWTCLKIIFHL